VREEIINHSTASELQIPGLGIWLHWKFGEPEPPGEGTRPTRIPVLVGPVPPPGGLTYFPWDQES
jgi:hypothetical protein